MDAFLDRLVANRALDVFFRLGGGENLSFSRGNRHVNGGTKLAQNLYGQGDALGNQQRRVSFWPGEFRDQRCVLGPQQGPTFLWRY